MRVRQIALALPEVVEAAHFKQPDFRVRNKIFATLPADQRIVCLKTTAANLDALVSVDGETFHDIWRGRWMSIRLDRVSLTLLRELLADSWRLVAPARLIVKSSADQRADGSRAARATSKIAARGI